MANVAWSLIAGAKSSAQGVGAPTDTFGFGASDGLNLGGVGGFALYASADAGQTITTPITAKAYTQNPYTLRWARNENWDVVSSITGVRDVQLGDFQVSSDAGRVAYVVTTGAVSSGNLTLSLVATGKPRAGELL